MYACILIRVFPGNVVKVLETVKGIGGVLRVFAVYGRYDIVAFVEAQNFASVIKVAGKINSTKGIRSTETAIEA